MDAPTSPRLVRVDSVHRWPTPWNIFSIFLEILTWLLFGKNSTNSALFFVIVSRANCYCVFLTCVFFETLCIVTSGGKSVPDWLFFKRRLIKTLESSLPVKKGQRQRKRFVLTATVGAVNKNKSAKKKKKEAVFVTVHISCQTDESETDWEEIKWVTLAKTSQPR